MDMIKRGTVFEYLQIILGITLASIGLKAFLLPNGFLDGGVTGIAILINQLFPVDISISLVLISIPFLVLGGFIVSRRIVIKSVLSILGLALFIHLENFSSITDDKLLIAIFGGLFLGAGIGLAIKNGSVLDGSEILGIYINNRFGISIGVVILIFNVALFAIAGLFLSVEVAMYSILTYLVTARVVDFMIKGFEDYVGLMIISRESQIIQERLVLELGVGLTVYNLARGFGSSGIQKEGDIIHVVVNRIDSRRGYRIIEDVDEHAFIVEFDVNHIKGGVLRKYLSKSAKELSPVVNQK